MVTNRDGQNAARLVQLFVTDVEDDDDKNDESNPYTEEVSFFAD